MDIRYVDLHVHSSESDGTNTPEELVELAKSTGISAFALTDHDTVKGIPAAKRAAQQSGVELISGVELSTDYKDREIHMLGLFIDDTNPILLEKLEYFRSSRLNRNSKMYQKLQDKGFSITEEQVQNMFPDSVLTRAHIARFLYEKKQIQSMDEAFDRYLGENGSCYVAREKITPQEAIRLIHQAGGIAVLAHPISYPITKSQLETLVSDCAFSGLDGIEAIYSTYQISDEHYIKKLARSFSLAISGGSDYHGDNKPHIQLGLGLGHLFVPYSVLENLKTIAKGRLI